MGTRISFRCHSKPTRTRCSRSMLKLAERSKSPKRVKVATPIVAAPVMLAEWKLEPDTAQRLVYRKGSLTPVGGVADVSGFAGLARIFRWQGCGASDAHAARRARLDRARGLRSGAMLRARVFTDSARATGSGCCSAASRLLLAGVGVHQSRRSRRNDTAPSCRATSRSWRRCNRRAARSPWKSRNVEDKTSFWSWLGSRGRRFLPWSPGRMPGSAEKKVVDDHRLDAARVGDAAAGQMAPDRSSSSLRFSGLAHRHSRAAPALANAAQAATRSTTATGGAPLQRRPQCSFAGADSHAHSRRNLRHLPKSPGRGNRDATDSRRRKVRARDGEDSLAGRERPAVAAVVRAGGVDQGQRIRTPR